MRRSPTYTLSRCAFLMPEGAKNISQRWPFTADKENFGNTWWVCLKYQVFSVNEFYSSLQFHVWYVLMRSKLYGQPVNCGTPHASIGIKNQSTAGLNTQDNIIDWGSRRLGSHDRPPKLESMVPGLKYEGLNCISNEWVEPLKTDSHNGYR